jgi:protein tyrosine/serine phosphatase
MGALLAVAIAQAGSGRGSSIQISNFGRVDDRFYRGAQPSGRDYKDLSSMGIKTVIDLEEGGESSEAGEVKNAGMKFYRIPMSDHSRPSEGAVRQFLQLVNDPANQPVFVHCHGGRHRTGAMTAVYRMTNYGWSANQAYGEMQRYDFNHGFGHGALKDFVFSYRPQLAQNRITTDGKAANSVATDTKAAKNVATDGKAAKSVATDSKAAKSDSQGRP